MPTDEMSIGTAVDMPAVGGTPVAREMDVQALMALAIEKDGAIEVIERLVELRNKEQERAAARSFHEAFARFKQLCPRIPKLKRGAGFVDRESGTTVYTWYADLETIQPLVDPILFALGLSYTWSNEATEKMVTTHCTLRHVDGHAVTSSMALPVSGPPKSSVTQGSSGTRSFGKRVTLSDVLGLSTVDDLDGRGDSGTDVQTVTEEQLANLTALFDEVRKNVDEQKFLAYFEADSLAEITQARYAEAVSALERKRS